MHAEAAGLMIANSKDEALMTIARGTAPGHATVNKLEKEMPIPIVSILKEDGERMERAIYQHEKPLYGDLSFNHQWKDAVSTKRWVIGLCSFFLLLVFFPGSGVRT